MLFVSIFTSERARDPELWATFWNGPAPSGLEILGAYNLASDKRLFIWRASSEAGLQFMDRLNEIGRLETYPAFNRTEGWRRALARDLEGFRRVLESRGVGPDQVEAALDLRRRAMEAPNRHAARAQARRWLEERHRPDDR